MQTKDVAPNRRCYYSQISIAMSPPSQGYESTRMVPECWLPKPVSTQALMGFPITHSNPSTHVSSTHLAPPKRMDLHPSLPCSPLGSPLSYFGLQHNWSRISMLELSGLVAVNNDRHRTMHLRHAGLK